MKELDIIREDVEVYSELFEELDNLNRLKGMLEILMTEHWNFKIDFPIGMKISLYKGGESILHLDNDSPIIIESILSKFHSLIAIEIKRTEDDILRFNK